MIDIFTSEDMENMSLCISQYLTLYYIIRHFIGDVLYLCIILLGFTNYSRAKKKNVGFRFPDLAFRRRNPAVNFLLDHDCKCFHLEKNV